MTTNRGFTLIELMIVVAVIGILAAIAAPSYIDYLRRGAIPEPIAALSDGKVKMAQFYQDNQSYDDGKGNSGCARIPTTAGKFTIACTSTANDFQLTATGSGIVSGFVYTINNRNTKTSTGVWGKSKPDCWILKKDGSC